MAKISEYTIEKIRNRADIYDIVSNYVNLKKRGRNFFGVCPFHSEKTASFSVNSEKQIFKCFGCGKGGSSIDFIMEYEKLDFVDAIKFLADQYSIQIEEINSKNKDISYNLYEINSHVASMYNQNLSDDKNKRYMDYFLKRGLTINTINEFMLGLSFSKDTILKTIQGKYNTNAMQKSGLFIDSKIGYLDRFRDRIMFTLFNNTGKVIGFAGRATKKNEMAKYINSPETPVYYKSKTLYGIHMTKSEISKLDAAIVVEGYMDFLQLYQNNIKNVVAVSGTSLTNDHAHILKRLSNNIYIAYDGDQAGMASAIRAGYVLLKNGLNPLIVEIPEGLDPDDWVRNDGAEPFLSSVKNSLSLLDFSYQQHLKNGKSDIAAFINENLNEIILIQDKVIAEIKLKELSSLTGISVDSIRDNFNNLMNKKNNRVKLKPIEKHGAGSKKIEDELIKLCFSKETKIRESIANSLNVEWLTDSAVIRIFEAVSIHLKSEYEPDPSVIMDQLKNKEDHEKLASILFEIDKFFPTIELALDCINRINYLWLVAKLEDLRNELKKAENNFQDENNIIKEIADIQTQINSLRGVS